MPVVQNLSLSGDKMALQSSLPSLVLLYLEAHYWSIKAFVINGLTFLLDPMVLIMLLWGDHWIIMEAMTF